MMLPLATADAVVYGALGLMSSDYGRSFDAVRSRRRPRRSPPKPRSRLRMRARWGEGARLPPRVCGSPPGSTNCSWKPRRFPSRRVARIAETVARGNRRRLRRPATDRRRPSRPSDRSSRSSHSCDPVDIWPGPSVRCDPPPSANWRPGCVRTASPIVFDAGEERSAEGGRVFGRIWPRSSTCSIR